MQKIKEIINNMQKAIIGKNDVLEKILICFLAKGHVLIEDVPGVGKTTMVKALAKTMQLSFGRIQFTPDLMPSDITGMSIYNRSKEDFVFRKGPIFNQIILADEINRTSPKTQSSLLQAMEEREVTIDEKTFVLGEPFMVLATQNPVEYQGTFPLPEAQLDRFLMKISLGYPESEHEKTIIRNYKKIKTLEELQAVVTQKDILDLQKEIEDVFVHEDLLHYIVGIANATRAHSDVYLGASPRASVDICKAAKALAYIRGRNYVIPDDIKEIVFDVLIHRIILSPNARIEGRKIEDVLKIVLKRVSVPVVNAIEG